MSPKIGALVKIPQSSYIYEKNSKEKYGHYVPLKELQKPELGIYFKSLDSEFSEVLIGDSIFVVENREIYPYKESRNVS